MPIIQLCGDQICELSEADIYSIVEGEDLLEDDRSCNYFAMKRDCAPVCMEDNTNVNIKHGGNLNLCQINEKRIDSEWGPWSSSETVIDTQSDLKITVSRDVFFEVADGRELVEGDFSKVHFWLYTLRCLGMRQS